MGKRLENSYEIEKFLNNGYLIIEKAVTGTDLVAFKKCLWNTIQVALKRYNVPFFQLKGSLEYKCNKGLIALRNANPEYSSFVQASISRSPEYYRLCSAPKIINYIHQLLPGITKETPIYLTNNGIIFTNPNDSLNKRTSNIELEWHKDTFFTIPKSHFLHVWVPILNNANESIGTLQICPGSHKEGIGKQIFNLNAQYDHRYTIDPDSVTKYEPISIKVNLGQALIFDSRLIHRSGKNKSKHVRCTLIGLYHAVSNSDFQPLSISYGYTDKTPERYFYEIFGDENILPVLSEQAISHK